MKPYRPSWQLESLLWSRGYHLVAGVDEAGRGALAGPVAAAAVILPYGEYPFNDSKALNAEVRELLAAEVKRVALAWGLGWASAQEIDDINVLAATKLAARRAVNRLELKPTALVTDYLKLGAPWPTLAVAKGDQRSLQVAAASLLAKTERDQLMRRYARAYPQYGFAGHKGYGAPRHLVALDQHGPCPIHRLSYKPVAQRRLFPVSDPS